MKAEALWVVEPNKMEIRPLEVAEPNYDEIQYKTKACGVCCWDSYIRGSVHLAPYLMRLVTKV